MNPLDTQKGPVLFVDVDVEGSNEEKDALREAADNIQDRFRENGWDAKYISGDEEGQESGLEIYLPNGELDSTGPLNSLISDKILPKEFFQGTDYRFNFGDVRVDRFESEGVPEEEENSYKARINRLGDKAEGYKTERDNLRDQVEELEQQKEGLKDELDEVRRELEEKDLEQTETRHNLTGLNGYIANSDFEEAEETVSGLIDEWSPEYLKELEKVGETEKLDYMEEKSGLDAEEIEKVLGQAENEENVSESDYNEAKNMLSQIRDSSVISEESKSELVEELTETVQKYEGNKDKKKRINEINDEYEKKKTDYRALKKKWDSFQEDLDNEIRIGLEEKDDPYRILMPHKKNRGGRGVYTGVMSLFLSENLREEGIQSDEEYKEESLKVKEIDDSMADRNQLENAVENTFESPFLDELEYRIVIESQ